MSQPEQPSNASYLAKLERRHPFSEDARRAFLELPMRSVAYEPYRDIVREGDRPLHSCLVTNGMVSRYKTLRNGARQILSFHIRGDMVDLESALVLVADHGIRTHTATTVATLAHGDILALAADHPEIGRAFWFDTLIDAAIFREWTVNVGRRNARERTAHLLLELAMRSLAAGLSDRDEYHLPISQTDLADAVGITPVHLNRTLQWLRGERLIRTISQTMIIENWPRMVALSGFKADYLHPEGPRQPPPPPPAVA